MIYEHSEENILHVIYNQVGMQRATRYGRVSVVQVRRHIKLSLITTGVVGDGGLGDH